MLSSTRLGHDTAHAPRHPLALSPTSPAFYSPPDRGRLPPSILGRNQTNKDAPPKLYCSTRKAILLSLRSYIGLTPEQYRCAHCTNKLDKPPYSVRAPPPCSPASPAHRLRSASTARPCHNLREAGFISRARTIKYKQERSDHPHSEGVRPPQRIALTLSTQLRKVRKSVVVPTKKE